ncbi:MAG: EF-P beta-lysylation protein EpmB [Gammaproteobacteria bacterium]
MLARSDKIDTRQTAGSGHTLSNITELFSTLNLPDEELAAAQAAAEQFPLKLPRRLLSSIPAGELNHPLLRQFLPHREELDTHDGYLTDPLAETNAQVAPGLLHKYHGRVLLITTAACAVHCRYCFRRHYPYSESAGNEDDWESALEYIRQDVEIREVILSGGDPLSLSDRRLKLLIRKLETIPHLHSLRIHSRTAALFPERITDTLVQLLADSRLQPVMVLHVNHADELNEACRRAMAKLASQGVILLNQSVLLAGVNDHIDTLTTLSRTLLEHRVIPYYLHLPDRVEATAHFAVTQQRGESLIAEMQRQLPGYLVPKLVVEIPHRPGKTVIA